MAEAALYRALIDAGASQELAMAASETMVAADQVATKSDLYKLEIKIAELEARLTWRLLGGIAIMLSIAVALIKFL